MHRDAIDQDLRRFQRTRSPEALAAVFDPAAPRLMLVAMHLVGDVAMAEDLVQTMFLAVLRDVDQGDASRAALPWLLGILEHRAHGWLRRAYRRRAYRTRERGEGALATELDASPAIDDPGSGAGRPRRPAGSAPAACAAALSRCRRAARRSAAC